MIAPGARECLVCGRMTTEFDDLCSEKCADAWFNAPEHKGGRSGREAAYLTALGERLRGLGEEGAP